MASGRYRRCDNKVRIADRFVVKANKAPPKYRHRNSTPPLALILVAHKIQLLLECPFLLVLVVDLECLLVLLYVRVSVCLQA
jgi:hypothetical protein